MKLDVIRKMGKKAFIQSLNPFKGGMQKGVCIFGLDTEYVPYEGKLSDLICWQLAGDTSVRLFKKKLSINNLCSEALKMVNTHEAKVLVFVCYFSLAEIQFFKLSEWQLSEFKGKYRLIQNHGLYRVMVVDLADWYPMEGLASVAKLWGLEKMDYPIVEKVEAKADGILTKAELLKDHEFTRYAKHDAVVTQKIYRQMREFFSGFGVDITKTLTPAATSAGMFRMGISSSIGQRDTILRSLSLECCWGGRMESLYRGTKPLVYEYDATGHHPSSVIALGAFPLESDWIKTQNLNVWLSGISGLGKVYFKFPEGELYPCLPIMMDDALVYVREGVSYCTVSEVRLAKRKGAKLLLFDGYYYRSGTMLLADYLKRIQDVRNQSDDPAQRKLLKLLSNSVIGKFFQKNVGVDLGKVLKYAEENQIPYDEVLKMKGVDFGEGQVTVGTLFYPEWYSLILGYARASISSVAEKHNALIISSDSFITEEDLGQEFDYMKIHFNLKAEGDLVSYRTRFYRVGEKIAHHAVHNKKAALVVLAEFSNERVFEYSLSRILHLRESWRIKKPFGCRIVRPMTTSLDFDYKRQLLYDGTTKPWGTTEERLQFLQNKLDYEGEGGNDQTDR